jgi:hypothetical protein
MGLPSDGDGDNNGNGTRPEGFRMCPTCGDMVRLVVQPQPAPDAPRRGRRQARDPRADQDPHARRCHGEPRSVTLGQQAKADTLRLLVEGMEEQGRMELPGPGQSARPCSKEHEGTSNWMMMTSM